MGYISLSSRVAQTAADQTGLNRGNYTSVFSPKVLGFYVAQFECYHMVVTSIAGGGQGTLYIDSRQWGFTFPVSGSEWDPSQPMLLTSGQELDILWNIPVSNTMVPVVTAWFRYDPSVPGNNT